MFAISACSFSSDWMLLYPFFTQISFIDTSTFSSFLLGQEDFLNFLLRFKLPYQLYHLLAVCSRVKLINFSVYHISQLYNGDDHSA